MFGSLKVYLVVGSIVFFFSSQASATTIALMNGEKIQGDIINQSETEVTLDVFGKPKTYFVGEIATIDGKELELPPVVPQVPSAQEPAPVQVPTAQVLPAPTVPVPAPAKALAAQKPPTPTVSVPAPAAKVPPVPTIPAPAPAVKPAVPHEDDQQQSLVRFMSNRYSAKLPKVDPSLPANKNVLRTSDGGVIVVSSDKITKYDENLNVIKQVYLNSNT